MGSVCKIFVNAKLVYFSQTLNLCNFMLSSNLVPALAAWLVLVCEVLDHPSFKFAREASPSATERKLN